jgi:hypothetical protein
MLGFAALNPTYELRATGTNPHDWKLNELGTKRMALKDAVPTGEGHGRVLFFHAGYF